MEAKSRVHVLEVKPAVSPNREPCLSITMGYYSGSTKDEPMMTATFLVRKDVYDQADVVRIGRHYLNGLCEFLAEETSDWKILKEDLEGMKLDTKSPSPDTAKSASTAPKKA